jgi:hypothetical protein
LENGTHLNAFLLQRLVDARVELQLLRPLGRLHPNDDMGDGLGEAAHRALGLHRAELRHLALIHLLRLLDPEPDGAPEVLHQNLGLLDLAGVHLAAHHRAEGHLVAKLVRDCERDGGLAGARRTGHQDGAARHPLGLYQVHHQARSLARLVLTHQAGGYLEGKVLIIY